MRFLWGLIRPRWKIQPGGRLSSAVKATFMGNQSVPGWCHFPTALTLSSQYFAFYKFRQNSFASLIQIKRSVTWGEAINSHLLFRLLPSLRWVTTLTSVSNTHLCTEMKKKNDTGVKKLPERKIQLLWKQAEVFLAAEEKCILEDFKTRRSSLLRLRRCISRIIAWMEGLFDVLSGS